MSADAALAAARSIADNLNVKKVTDAVIKGKRPFFSIGLGYATHVANDYHLPIIASVRIAAHIPAEHVVIPPGEYFRFVPDHSKQYKTTYVTVISVDAEGNQVHKFIDVPKKADYSVKMSNEGFLVDVKYGTIWQKA